MGILGTIFGKIIGEGVGGKVVDYFTRKAELAAQARQEEAAIRKAETERKIELISKGLTADMNWEMEFARQAQSSWKDEYTLLVTSIPAILSFIPGGSAYVKQGFEALAATPIWYQILLSSMFLATIGVRYWRKTQSDT